MAIPVNLQVFEGPLDLLLHLVEINKIDIYDIPIAEITDQYLEYISKMPVTDMDMMSEFLVMAAVLLRIKSKEMLPPPEEPEDEEEIDEKTELFNRLYEYKMYKYAASLLRDEGETAGNRIFRERVIPEDLHYEEPPVDLKALADGRDLDTLKQIFDEVIRKQSYKIDPVRSRYGRVVREKYTVNQAIGHIRTRIARSKRTSFRKLLEEKPDRISIIVTFLAVLEMTRNNEITISQDAPFDDIIITPGGGTVE